MFGLIWMLRRGNGAAGVLLLALIANVYLIGGLGLSQVAYGTEPVSIGWLHHWDDAPSFGMRYLAECAPVFAFGLAGLLQAVHRHVHLVIWIAAFALAAIWNGLLIVAYGVQTITRSGCLPYSDMVKGIGQAVGMLVRHQL
jgi:hypothetical protein